MCLLTFVACIVEVESVPFNKCTYTCCHKCCHFVRALQLQDERNQVLDKLNLVDMQVTALKSSNADLSAAVEAEQQRCAELEAALAARDRVRHASVLHYVARDITVLQHVRQSSCVHSHNACLCPPCRKSRICMYPSAAACQAAAVWNCFVAL